MSFNEKNILMILGTALGVIALSVEFSRYPEPSYPRVLLYLALVFYFPFNRHETKKKISVLKRKYNLEGNYTLEEIEKIRIEKDYQETFVKKLNLK